jgi:hypothetical protein
MRALVLSLGFVLGLFGSMAYAQNMSDAELAELELARQVAVELGQPAPTTLAAARAMISSAPANVVLIAVATVSANSPTTAALVGAAAARNNNGVSVAAAAGAAGVAVNQVAQNMGGQRTVPANNDGGAPSEEDIIATLEEDLTLADDFNVDDNILNNLVEQVSSGAGSSTAQN